MYDDYELDERMGFERDLDAIYDAFGYDFDPYAEDDEEYEWDDDL